MWKGNAATAVSETVNLEYASLSMFCVAAPYMVTNTMHVVLYGHPKIKGRSVVNGSSNDPVKCSSPPQVRLALAVFLRLDS